MLGAAQRNMGTVEGDNAARAAGLRLRRCNFESWLNEL